MDLSLRAAGEPQSDRWVFGYGSLMWRPGFDYVDRRVARLHGRRRAFCIYSVHHRGTYGRPGLVLGLAPGGSTRGLAYRVAAADWPEVYAYLCEREQPTETYFEAWAPVSIEAAQGGRKRAAALVFLSDPAHPQWAGDLSLDRQAALIAGARGLSGRNVDYLRDLVAHMGAMGLADGYMRRLLARVEALEAQAQGLGQGRQGAA